MGVGTATLLTLPLPLAPLCMGGRPHLVLTPKSMHVFEGPTISSYVHCCRECFVRWWRWEQRSLHGKRGQILGDLGARAAPVLSEHGLVPDAKGLFTIQCPSCRW